MGVEPGFLQIPILSSFPDLVPAYLHSHRSCRAQGVVCRPTAALQMPCCFEMGFSLPPTLHALLYTRAVEGSVANGDLLGGGPLPLAVDEMLRHLSREVMAAGCVSQTLRLQEGTFAWLQSFAEAPQGMMELGPFTSESPQPSLEQNCRMILCSNPKCK